MPRLALILSMLFCCGWGEVIVLGGGVPEGATPTPTATPTAAATPTATPTPDPGALYSLDLDCSDLTDWDDIDMNTAGTSWTENTGVSCKAVADGIYEEAALVSDTANNTTTEFCSFQVVAEGNYQHYTGCIFRTDGAGNHIAAEWSNKYNTFYFQNHPSDHTHIDEVQVSTFCAQNGTCSFARATAPKWYGIKLTGEGDDDVTGMAAQWWDLGSDGAGGPDADADPEDPSTWDDNDGGVSMVCECDADETNDDLSFTEIDTEGYCGLETTQVTTSTYTEITSFVCGDQ